MRILPVASVLCPLLLVAVAVAVAGADAADADYEADVRHALAAIEARCGALLTAKGVDLTEGRREILGAVAAVDSAYAHRALLVRLVARLRDGQAAVRSTDASRGVRDEEGDAPLVGPGLRLCIIGGKLVVKNSWAGAARIGIEPGMQLVQVAGRPATAWLGARMEALALRQGFSTPQQALFHACHAGLGAAPGTTLDLVLADRAGRRHRRTLTYDRAGLLPAGPAFPPGDLAGGRDASWGRTPAGFGYVHLRRGSRALPYRLEDALHDLAGVSGLVLDLRGHSGSSFDAAALLGRFVLPGDVLVAPDGSRLESRGAVHYGGPLVVLVDGTVRGAAEIAAAHLAETGRAWLVGESATAGSCARRATIVLPSRLFELWVSTRSALPRFDGGRGLEGVGVTPHEVRAFDRSDLAAGVDTLIRRAETLLADPLPVTYEPVARGWRAPPRPRGG